MSDQEELSAPAAIPLDTPSQRTFQGLGGLEKKVKMVPEEPGVRSGRWWIGIERL